MRHLDGIIAGNSGDAVSAPTGDTLARPAAGRLAVFRLARCLRCGGFETRAAEVQPSRLGRRSGGRPRWPPMDVNGDGRMDMVINEEDVPYNESAYVYENPGSKEKMPIFKPGRRPGRRHDQRPGELRGTESRGVDAGQGIPGLVHLDLRGRSRCPWPRTCIPTKSAETCGVTSTSTATAFTDPVIGIDDWTDYGEPWTGYNAYDSSGKMAAWPAARPGVRRPKSGRQPTAALCHAVPPDGCRRRRPGNLRLAVALRCRLGRRRRDFDIVCGT